MTQLPGTGLSWPRILTHILGMARLAIMTFLPTHRGSCISDVLGGLPWWVNQSCSILHRQGPGTWVKNIPAASASSLKPWTTLISYVYIHIYIYTHVVIAVVRATAITAFYLTNWSNLKTHQRDSTTVIIHRYSRSSPSLSRTCIQLLDID